MKNYYVNKNAQSNGYHEVHEETCTRLPDVNNREYLGTFYNCKDAVDAAKKKYSKSDGCYYCSSNCNKY
ncbi:hypothetical protein SAMN05443292_2209 [Halpernia frigidisoli]|uniref:Uncharacterized protein n=1 Tax=Halpernia frigidisoli TaxID=1125876 RepID=A0A1I3HI06_9FLAO|nr:hypothetical protein SAMN05443292_2209 [Halpernia frigidisoli]